MQPALASTSLRVGERAEAVATIAAVLGPHAPTRGARERFSGARERFGDPMLAWL